MKIRKRWTILNVEEKTIKAVSNYAEKHQVRVSRALKELIQKGSSNED